MESTFTINKKVKLHDLQFRPYISAEEIERVIALMGQQINANYQGKNPLFLGILNGAFKFAADLMTHVNIDCEISFVKIRSYEGTESTGEIKMDILPYEKLEGRHIILLEDIVDTGKTLHSFIQELQQKGPAVIDIVTLLNKPEAQQYELPITTLGFEIPDKFVVGFGLDYNGLGRNLNDIYILDA